MIVRPLLACIIVAGLFSCTGRRAQRTDLALEADQQREPQVASGEDDENQGPPKELFTSKSNYYTKRHFAKLHQKLDEETRWHIERSKSSEILADEFFQEN